MTSLLVFQWWLAFFFFSTTTFTIFFGREENLFNWMQNVHLVNALLSSCGWCSLYFVYGPLHQFVFKRKVIAIYLDGDTTTLLIAVISGICWRPLKMMQNVKQGSVFISTISRSFTRVVFRLRLVKPLGWWGGGKDGRRGSVLTCSFSIRLYAGISKPSVS